ncbi:MAG: hypothetical protein ABIQ40_12890 [Bacteroidia bacterium]
MRYLLFILLLSSFSLFAQRDSVIGGIKCHLVSSDADTGTAWIQNKQVTKKGVVKFRGVYWEFYPGGKLKAKGYYKNGKQNEKWIRYYSGGQKAEQGYFDKGFKSDLWMTYYESGIMSWKGNYYKNMRSGFWRYYYESGAPKSVTRYRIKTQSIAKRPKGAKRGMSISANREITYSISPADSLIEYYPDGKLRTRIIYGKEGGLNGNFTTYYPDGNVNTSGTYTTGKKSGEWIYYCTDGSVLYAEKYLVPGGEAAKGKDKIECAYDEILPWMKWEIELITP